MPVSDSIFSIFFIVVATIALILLAIFIKRKRASKALTDNKISTASLQEEYQAKKNKNSESKLTPQEKLEASWQFLYDIAEVVLNKFSKEDQDMVKKIGNDLGNNGMTYEHVIDFAMKKTKSHTQSLQDEKQKETAPTIAK